MRMECRRVGFCVGLWDCEGDTRGVSLGLGGIGICGGEKWS